MSPSAINQPPAVDVALDAAVAETDNGQISASVDADCDDGPTTHDVFAHGKVNFRRKGASERISPVRLIGECTVYTNDAARSISDPKNDHTAVCVGKGSECLAIAQHVVVGGLLLELAVPTFSARDTEGVRVIVDQVVKTSGKQLHARC